MWPAASSGDGYDAPASYVGVPGAWAVGPATGSDLGGYRTHQAGVLSESAVHPGQVVAASHMDDAHLQTDAIYEERMRRAAFLQAKAITAAAQQSNPRGLPMSGVVTEAFPGMDPSAPAWRESTQPSSGMRLLNPQWEQVLRYGYRGVRPDNNAVLSQDWQARSRDHLLVAPLTARDNLMSLVLRATSSPAQTYSPHMKPLGRRVAEHMESPYFAEDNVRDVEREYVFSGAGQMARR